MQIKVLVDASSVQLVGNNGKISIADLLFPGPDSTKVECSLGGGKCQLLTVLVRTLKSFWHAKTN